MLYTKWIYLLLFAFCPVLSWSSHTANNSVLMRLRESNFPAPTTFKSAIKPLVDLDGDGVSEFAVGLPSLTYYLDILVPVSEQPDAGMVKIFSGKNHQQLAQFQLPKDSGSYSFGSSVSLTADYDGDTVPDLAVGAPYYSGLWYRGGRVYFLSLKKLMEHRPVNEVILGYRETLREFEDYGSTLSLVSDLNQDGKRELVIGCPNCFDTSSSNFNTHRGRIDVISGNSFNQMIFQAFGEIGNFSITFQGGNFGKEIISLQAFEEQHISLPRGHINLGFAVSAPQLLGFINNSGQNSLIGKIYIYRVNSSGQITLAQTVSGTNHSEEIGYSLSNLGNLNSHPANEIAFSVRATDPVNILFGFSSKIKIFDLGQNQLLGEIHPPHSQPFSNFATGLADGVDLNGDGVRELIVAETVLDRNEFSLWNLNSLTLINRFQVQTQAGPSERWQQSAVMLTLDGTNDLRPDVLTYSQKSGVHFIQTYGNFNATKAPSSGLVDQWVSGSSLQANSYTGLDIANVGDLNSDGTDELAVVSVTDAGEMALQFMDLKLKTLLSEVIFFQSQIQLPGQSQNTHGQSLGLRVVGLGDINRDHVPDVAVSLPYYNGERGLVLILSGSHLTQAPSFSLNSNSNITQQLGTLIIGAVVGTSIGDRFGAQLVKIKLPGDNLWDLAVSMPNQPQPGGNSGSVLLIDSRHFSTHPTFSTSASFIPRIQGTGVGVGYHLSSLNDILAISTVGKVDVYRVANLQPTLIASLQPPSTAIGFFGYATSLTDFQSRTYLAVGAPGSLTLGQGQRGDVFLYDLAIPQAPFHIPSFSQENHSFGYQLKFQIGVESDESPTLMVQSPGLFSSMGPQTKGKTEWIDPWGLTQGIAITHQNILKSVNQGEQEKFFAPSFEIIAENFSGRSYWVSAHPFETPIPNVAAGAVVWQKLNHPAVALNMSPSILTKERLLGNFPVNFNVSLMGMGDLPVGAAHPWAGKWYKIIGATTYDPSSPRSLACPYRNVTLPFSCADRYTLVTSESGYLTPNSVDRFGLPMAYPVGDEGLKPFPWQRFQEEIDFSAVRELWHVVVVEDPQTSQVLYVSAPTRLTFL